MMVAVLQARMSSTRLPNKVLMPILGKPMLAFQIERLSRCRKIDFIVIATSIEASDDAIEDFCEALNITCFRGSLDNVLDRYYQVALKFKAEHVLRTTGDCPLVEPSLIDDLISEHLAQKNDYTAINMPVSWPHGLDVEAIKFESLKRAWQEAYLPEDKEHVTPYLRNHPEQFTIGNILCEKDYSHHRWTVDYAEDFFLVRTIFEKLYPENSRFGMAEILDLLNIKPDLKKISTRIVRA
jgi:spore coat polysaccharide biosynthesis protein SpsF